MSGTYQIVESMEHCHRCGKLRKCVVRWNNVRPEAPRKTALCQECAPKECAPKGADMNRETGIFLAGAMAVSSGLDGPNPRRGRAPAPTAEDWRAEDARRVRKTEAAKAKRLRKAEKQKALQEQAELREVLREMAADRLSRPYLLTRPYPLTEADERRLNVLLREACKLGYKVGMDDNPHSQS